MERGVPDSLSSKDSYLGSGGARFWPRSGRRLMVVLRCPRWVSGRLLPQWFHAHRTWSSSHSLSFDDK